MYDYLDLRQTERLKELVPYKALAPDADEIIKELDRLNNIIDEADTKNLELIQKINKIYDVIKNKNITGIEARLLIQDILDKEE